MGNFMLGVLLGALILAAAIEPHADALAEERDMLKKYRYDFEFRIAELHNTGHEWSITLDECLGILKEKDAE